MSLVIAGFDGCAIMFFIFKIVYFATEINFMYLFIGYGVLMILCGFVSYFYLLNF